ncbi:MAG: hypothetical protein J6K31_00930 [Parabacteroides sp.]|nr:hypothetical protein [Parabacteroides sp.]
MNIRNVGQYIVKLCGQETLHLLGTNKELLLQKIYGQDPSRDQVKSVISDAASFASNAEEQLFYEFVQNAYDASANSLFFYANEKYLIVLNNGEPFYTDFDIFESESVRDGQLYNFLAKGKSLKRSDSNKLGKYGQGSKLLYTLLTEVSESEENEELLIKTLYDEKKGPYLISWYDRKQLANLLQKQGEWIPAQGDDYKENILFAKILMSYYPIAPGTSEELFSTKEALDAIEAFDSLVDPRRNFHFLNRGTALIIPLGKGKYEKITSGANLERVKTRLGGFASITKDQERNEGKTVDHIYVMGEEVEQHEVQSVFVDFKVDGKPFYYHFAFNPIFAERNFVNLFKGLPILETKLRLGFIIDSQKFDVDSSRQRISDKEKTKGQLIRAFAELVKELRELKNTNPTKFDYIYKAIAATKYLDGEDFKFIKEAFQEVFMPFFEEFVLTSTGEYDKKENVRSFEEKKQIPLKEIGISKYKWIDDAVKNDLKRHKVDVEVINFSTLLSDADSTKLSVWIKTLSTNDYKVFNGLCDFHKNESGVQTYKIFRSNKGNLYSYNELRSTNNIYYAYEEGMKFGECEHISEILSDIDLSNYISNLFEKIKTNITSFRVSDSTKDDAANLLAWIASKSESYISRIRSEILLLQNWHDTYDSFDNIMLERPNDTILFDKYCVKGYIPEAVKTNNWLLNPAKAKKPCWQWVISHWENLQNNEEWGENTHKYISDIKTVYKAVGTDAQSNVDKTELTLYLDEYGKPTSQLRAVVNNVSRLSEEEYNYLAKKVSHLRLLPYEYHKELMEAPFRVETVQSANIVNDSLTADETLLRIFIKITDAYLQLYRTQENSGKYIITKTSSGYNYIDSVSSELQSELLAANFYRIPNNVQEVLQTESGKYRFASNETMLLKAIERLNNPIKLFPFVKQANANVVESFFNKLNNINIDSEIKKEDLKWQIIEFAVQRNTDENEYIDTVFGLIRHKDNELPASITQQFVKVGANEYDVYVLDEDYKKDNQTIDSFLKCLPSQTEIDYFKEHYYKGKEDEVDTQVLFEELSTHYLSIEQLRFCIDYAIANNTNCDDLEITEDESLTDALDMILKNNFEGFDNHFKMEDVDFDKQVYAKHEILLESEFLPDVIQKWIDNNPSSLHLFTRLITSSNPYIAVRQALLDNEAYSDVVCFADVVHKGDIDNTINWAIEKKLNYTYMSERYYTMMAIIEKLPSEYVVMPFLRYTGNVAPVENEFAIPKPIFMLERYQDGGSFLSWYAWAGSQFQERLNGSKKLAKFIKDSIVYLYGDKELLFNHGFKKNPRWNLQTSVDIKDFPEHDDPVYQLWKKSDESKGITIHTSERPIMMKFNIMSSNTSIFADKMHDSEFGYEPGKRVIVQQPNKDGLSLMRTIAKHISSMDFFQQPFIALQSLYVDQWELLQQGTNGDNEENGKSNIDLTNSSLTEEQAQEAINKISTETAENIEQVNNITKQMNGDELDKLNEMAKSIKELIEGLDKEDIERLAEKKDKILQMMDDLTEAEAEAEEEKGSQVRQTIGFIGELIYSHYLENKKLVKDKDFIHAALEGVGEYDFEIKAEKIFVDVKTTLYSLKDGTAPFYLHCSQNVFMQKHPDSKYHIVRISLVDLNLKQSYEELRDTYGKDANPMENPHLRKRCEDVSKKYWKGAKIEEFDALSPEYAIRIEQKQNQ